MPVGNDGHVNVFAASFNDGHCFALFVKLSDELRVNWEQSISQYAPLNLSWRRWRTYQDAGRPGGPGNGPDNAVRRDFAYASIHAIGNVEISGGIQ